MIQVFYRYANQLAFIILCTIVLLLVVDTSVARLYTIIYGNVFYGNNFDSSNSRNVLGFALITITCLVVQYILMKVVTNKTKRASMKGHLHLGKVHLGMVTNSKDSYPNQTKIRSKTIISEVLLI
jgi:hypothetical protein